MTVAGIALPRILKIGGGASQQLAEVLGSLGVSRPLVVTDSFLAGQGMVEQLLNGLRAAEVSARVFTETVPDPTVASIEAGLAFLKDGDHDCVVGFGGGSPLDSAKAIAMLAVHGGVMADYKVPHVQDAPGLPVIAIPTTAGTGSEATRFTIVTDGETDEKMLCAGLAYLPVAALVDYELTLGKPRRPGIGASAPALAPAALARYMRPMDHWGAGQGARWDGCSGRQGMSLPQPAPKRGSIGREPT